MNVKNNKRHLETKGRIVQALIALLQNKSLREISVSDICEIADINRSTFYAHYEEVSALAKAFCAETETEMASQPHTSDDFSWVFAYIKEHQETFKAYFKLGMVAYSTADYRMLFFANGVHSVAKMWFENGCIEPEEEMGSIIMREFNKLGAFE